MRSYRKIASGWWIPPIRRILVGIKFENMSGLRMIIVLGIVWLICTFSISVTYIRFFCSTLVESN
jgi:hypothetical protein